jgi:hypothetical protein
VCSTAQAVFTESILVDKLQFNLPALPTSANAWMSITNSTNIPGVMWNIGPLTKADEGRTFTLDESSASQAGVNWQQVREILSSESMTFTKVIDAGVLQASVVYDWPFPDAPIPTEQRIDVVSMQFHFMHFITERVNNKNQAYIAGVFSEQISNAVPEPTSYLFVLLGMVLLHRWRLQHDT